MGSGTGPRTFACVRTTVSTIFFVDWSIDLVVVGLEPDPDLLTL